MRYFNTSGGAKSIPMEAAQKQGSLFTPPAPPPEQEPTMIPEVEPSMVSRMEEPGGKELADWATQQ